MGNACGGTARPDKKRALARDAMPGLFQTAQKSQAVKYAPNKLAVRQAAGGIDHAEQFGHPVKPIAKARSGCLVGNGHQDTSQTFDVT